MKTTIVFVISVLAFCISSNAQIINPKETTKRKVEERTNNTTDKTIDWGLDKIESGIEGLFKKKDKKQKDKKAKQSKVGDNGYNSPSGNGATPESMPDFSAYEDFDFIPGEKILFFDDFSQNVDGVKPEGWEGLAEISSATDSQTGQKGLSVIHGGGFFPTALKPLPEDFTIEFDVILQPEVANGTLDLRFVQASETNLADPWFTNATQISFSGSSQIPKKGACSIEQKDSQGNIIDRNDAERYFTQWHTDENPRARISISKKGDKASVWINQTKIWDEVSLFDTTTKYKLTFHFGDYFIEDISFMMTNLKIATNAPEVKNDMGKGKFSTANILFDTNSDAIKPQSFSILKDIAQTLKASPEMRIQIIGHTDSDGNADDNLDLSTRRALAVKNVLSNVFDVDVSQYTTEGKGESEPLNKNANASEKAQNRRVEFVKI